MQDSRNTRKLSNYGWRQTVLRVAPVSAILFLIAFGALAAPQYQDHDHDRDRDRDHDRDRGGVILIVGAERTPHDFGGGHGGGPSPDALCDTGFVAVGFHVQTGEYYNQAWLECAPMRSDGSLGEERRLTSRTGSRGGAPVHDAYCTPGHVLRGLRGRVGASIDVAAGECSSLRDIAERFDNPATDMTQEIARPRPGGGPVQGECPAGSVVTGFHSNSGEYMDHLWLLCSEIHRSY